MKGRRFRVWALAVATGLAAGSAAMAAQRPPARLTLEQAITQVQLDTGGTVLSAEPRRLGRRIQYRIKVLTPEGHVQVIVVSSDAKGHPVSMPTTKHPAARGPGNKEKH